jgi:hypothetical protein
MVETSVEEGREVIRPCRIMATGGTAFQSSCNVGRLLSDQVVKLADLATVWQTIQSPNPAVGKWFADGPVCCEPLWQVAHIVGVGLWL